ncbi:N-acetylmuramoyl-L-alanine amidase [Modestobacter sp. I12A-02628]|uniref:N-acetylmuramoyl-L-alanine amidase n=1 Tax=Goekera deserti TaxID=2497753 RepID=A0A7K3WIE9_9ACTN|nr:N-acetylmuramoyl-L-alanine amidase [Goekera deserti]MPR00142.1 N-acetylmuramoyl-L-alanine amidase [Goekera deserti]NDI49921.1 N-acetylmuramoyl-L-alanine amidase [Goekera deserti]NDI49926.1 N-acetylmuramoyl-L-alanine amidase [Goekera deserti]NEL55283.1 N-acetylmuramoyl-L-alanine amidase [Goekera deserti]
MEPLGPGDRGPAVTDVRAALRRLGLLGAATAHGAHPNGTGDDAPYDAETELAVRHFQQVRGLSVDGRVGEETYQALTEARWSLGDRLLRYDPERPLRGDDVTNLQERLLELGYDAGRADGILGAETEAGLRAFQRDYGLIPDGTCGPGTLRALKQLGRRVTGGRPQLLRQSAVLVESGPHLIGRVIVIDPGHGGEDTGYTAGETTESDLVFDLASRIEGRLAAAGAKVFLTRGRTGGPDMHERTAFANDARADLFISLHMEAHGSPHARGVASYYYGNGSGVSSTVGEQFANLLRREVIARTGMLDCGSHAKTWDLLRLTRMPAVRVDCGYLSHPVDRMLLLDARLRSTIAQAAVAAVQRLFLPAENDPKTGTFLLPTGI